MKALLQVVSLVVISMVVIINPSCGAMLGERKA
ncbi:ilv operon leader peptide [Candidatus Pantoea persica]|nr:ilv operon leader peptide [Candidatus Pantoea persica]